MVQAITSPELVDLLVEGARYGDAEDVKLALDQGASIDCRDEQGRTGLHMASANGSTEVVHLLLQSGADVNAQNEQKNTPLHYACLLGHTEVVQRLLANGADLSCLNSHERSPVDEALGKPHQDAVLALVNAWGQQATASGDAAELECNAEDAVMEDDSIPRKHLPPPEAMQTDAD